MSFRIVTFCAGMTLLAPLGIVAAEPQGKLVVKVEIEGTGKPVAGATVHANLGIVREEEDKTFPPEQLTDEEGRYELAVPWGNVRLTAPIPPPGFWPVTDKSFGINQLQQFVITRQQPVVEKRFAVKKGTAWPMKVVTAAGLPLPDVYVHAYRSSDQSKSALVTDAAGQGRLTLPADGGKMSAGFFQRRLSLNPRKHAFMEIEPGFDPQEVVSQMPVAEGTKVELTDKQGHKAVWEGCSAVLSGGAVELVFAADNPPDSPGAGELAGTVVDQHGQPIEGAYVRCYAPGVDLLESLGKTSERGEFRFRGLLKSRGSGDPAGIHLMVKKDGYAGIESRHFFSPNADGLHQFEQALVLQPGCLVPLRIVDETGQPLEGAWVTDYEGAVKIAKSDEAGYCTLRNVLRGTRNFHVDYGDLKAIHKAEAQPESTREPPVVVRLTSKLDPLYPLSQRPNFNLPKAGEPAPEWSIREWTDGKERTLESLRGRVVVIDFWSLGCTPCRQVTLPVENKLRPKFAQDVTFIHIHPAGTESHLVKELLAVQNWDLLVGLDSGASESESQTLKRYGVAGYPTEVIVDRQGRIVYHSHEGRDDREKAAAAMKATAAEIGLPWPIEKDADQEEIGRRLRRYHEHWMTKEIEKALAK